MSLSPKFDIRSAALLFAALLSVHTLWVLGSELIRPKLGPETKFPAPVAPEDIDSLRTTSLLAASFGLIRGDLWSVRALVDAANVLGGQDAPEKILTQPQVDGVRAAAERALSLKPLDSRVWLILAALSSQDVLAKEQLKLSYYTGPNDRRVMAYRLKFATLPNALESREVREAVRREIRTILIRAPELKPIIAAAYAGAKSEGRQFIEMIVLEFDPSFMTTLNALRPK